MQNNQDEFLSLLATKLQIEPCDSLKKSTFMGKPYWGANPSFRTKTFDHTRHQKPLQLKRYEVVIFSIINHKYLDSVGYSQIHLSILERIFGFLYLLVPLQDEINWFLESYYRKTFKNLPYGPDRLYFSNHKHLLGLIYDRVVVFAYFLRNITSSHYQNMSSRVIRF